MRIQMRGKNVPVAEALRDYTEKKVKKLERFFHSIDNVEIAQSQERGLHIIELSVEGDGTALRSEERCNDMYAAIDNAIEKIERQAKRFKTRMRDDRRRPNALKEHGVETTSVLETEEEEDGLHPIRILRRKRFPIKPMSAEEAARQMELGDHDFFLFANEETGEFNVLYRRRNGGYGLIEPEG